MSHRDDWMDEAVRLSKLWLANGSEVYEERLESLASENGFVARLRDDETLVLYPDDWVVEGEVRIDRIEDTDRAHEIPLSEKGENWDEVHNHNNETLEEYERRENVSERDVSNAEYFTEYIENHYLLAVEEVSRRHVREFLDEYYTRNVWSSPDEEDRLEESLRKLLGTAGLSRDEIREYLRDAY